MNKLNDARSIHSLLQSIKECANPKKSLRSAVDFIQPLRNFSKTDWKNLVEFDKDHYARKVLFPKGDTTSPVIEVVLIGWLPGQRTTIHGHKRGCLLKVLDGCIKELRYCKNNRTKILSETIHYPGSITFIDNDIGLHEVINTSISPAVTMHLYDAPVPKHKKKFKKYKFFSEQSTVLEGAL